MLIIYKKQTGEIKYTIDGELDSSWLNLKEDEELLTTLVEHGSKIITLRVDITKNPPQLVSKIGVAITPNKTLIKPGETVIFGLYIEGSALETIPIKVNNQILQVSSSQQNFEITFVAPGEYYVYVPDNRYYCRPIKIEVTENNQ